MPRGPSLGHTAYIPEKERYHVTKQQLLAMMDTMMGGRAAEEIIFGPEKITSGGFLVVYVLLLAVVKNHTNVMHCRRQQRSEAGDVDCTAHGEGLGHVREGRSAHNRKPEGHDGQRDAGTEHHRGGELACAVPAQKCASNVSFLCGFGRWMLRSRKSCRTATIGPRPS